MLKRTGSTCIPALFLVFFIMAGCSIAPVTKPYNDALPPVLMMEELPRPYVKLGRIQVVREVHISDYWVDPNLQEWGLKVLREEAMKISADAVILPEITSRQLTVAPLPGFPTTEYRATGTAIRFK